MNLKKNTKSYFLKSNDLFVNNDILYIDKRGFREREFKWDLPIKYWIDPKANLNTNLIEKTLKDISKKTCITWEKMETIINNTTGLNIRNSGLCASFVGRLSRDMPQEITFTQSCLNSGRIQHEFSHALGLVHENRRPDNEKYITINFTNVEEKDFKKLKSFKNDELELFNISYDYGSLMHHSSTIYSKNNLSTILTNDPNYQNTIGQDNKLKFNDIKKLNLIYCNNVCKKKPLKCKNGGYMDPKNCKKCRCPPHYGGKTCKMVKKMKKKCKNIVKKATASKKTFEINGKINCYYYITSSSNYKIKLIIQNSNLPQKENNGVCIQGKALEVLYRKDPSVVGAMFCGINKNVTILSESNKVSINYVGNSDKNFVKISFQKVKK
uniref:Metalloendopeptidase n=1 Tax=Strongyloides stercoralis TaxID=6248 RepID=A0AAF5D402_STRER